MLSVPTGYFIYDFFDMVMNQKLAQSWELLFHHIVVGLNLQFRLSFCPAFYVLSNDVSL